MPTVKNIVDQLKGHASAANVAGMARFGMTAERRLGVSVPVMRRTAKETGKDHKLALKLWKTGIPEAGILASMVAIPEKLTEKQMDAWVKNFNSWDVCDQVCMNLFDRSPFARRKIVEWSRQKEEYIKRAAFALIASVACHDKRAPDEDFIKLLPLIKRGATDERNFVKKAVNWALRTIGKRNVRLSAAALRTAREIQRLDSKAAHWIAADAIRELEAKRKLNRLQK